MTEEAPAPRVFPWRPVAAVGLLVLLLVVQYSLFHRHARREIVWAYPDHFDQAGYLGLTYTAYEHLRTEGLGPTVCRELGTPRATGVLFPLEGSLFLYVLGPSRLSALTMHFAHFALFEVALFGTLAWLTRRWSVAWLGVGLLLTALAPFVPAGGMFDYHLDFTALCLFGITMCVAIRSRLFASWGWSAAVGAVGAWMILSRSLTAAYLAGVLGLFFLFVCVRWWRGRGSDDVRALARRQLGGLLVAGAVLAALTGPFFWSARHEFYVHYGLSHLLGAQSSFRNAGIGVRNTLDWLAYYPDVLAREHLGPTFLVLAVLLPAAVACLRRAANRGQAGSLPSAAPGDWTGLWFFAACCLVVPFVVLNLDTVKNTCVAGIVLPGLVWLTAAALASLSRGGLPDRSAVLRGGLPGLAVLAVLAGLCTQLVESRRPGPYDRPRWGYHRIGELYDALADHCREMGWTEPLVAATCLETDCFQPVVIPALVYERQHLLITPRTERMGGYLWAITEADACDEMRRSDFVILVDPAQAPSAYPFDQSIRPMFPKLKAFCEANLTPLRRLHVWHFNVVLYTRPAQVAASSDTTREVSP